MIGRRLTRKGNFRFCKYCVEPYANSNEVQDKLGPIEDKEELLGVEVNLFLDWLIANKDKQLNCSFMELVIKY